MFSCVHKIAQLAESDEVVCFVMCLMKGRWFLESQLFSNRLDEFQNILMIF